MKTDEIEALGLEVVSLIIEEDLVDNLDPNLFVWSGRSNYVIGGHVKDKLSELQQDLAKCREEKEELEAFMDWDDEPDKYQGHRWTSRLFTFQQMKQAKAEGTDDE